MIMKKRLKKEDHLEGHFRVFFQNLGKSWHLQDHLERKTGFLALPKMPNMAQNTFSEC